jgi:hypothetical protein
MGLVLQARHDGAVGTIATLVPKYTPRTTTEFLRFAHVESLSVRSMMRRKLIPSYQVSITFPAWPESMASNAS